MGKKRLYAALACFLAISAITSLLLLPVLKQCMLTEHFGNGTPLKDALPECAQQTATDNVVPVAAMSAALLAILAMNPAKVLAEATKSTASALITLTTISAGLLLPYFAPGKMLLYDGLVFQAASFSYYQMLSDGQLPHFFFNWALGSMHPAYHGQVFFTLAGAANFLFNNIDAAFRTTAFLLHISSAVTAFCLVKYLLKDNRAALAGGLAYALIPEHTIKMLLLGRTIAAPIYALLPVAILIIERFADGRTGRKALVAGMAIIAAAMFLSSPQDAQVTIALLFGYLVLRTTLNGKPLRQAAKAAALATAAGTLFLLLTAYWTVPYLLESEHVNTLQQKAIYEYTPKIPGRDDAAKALFPATGIAQLLRMNIKFTLDYLGLTLIAMAAFAAVKSRDRRIRLIAAYGAMTVLLGLFVTQRTGIVAALAISVAAAGGVAMVATVAQAKKPRLANAAYAALLIIIIADLGAWALIPPMPDFSQQETAYGAIPQGAEGTRVLDLHSNRRTYYPTLVYIQRNAQVPFSVLTTGDPKAFYYAATVASRAAQETYDFSQPLSRDVLEGLYMYNIGYLITHPDQKGIPAERNLEDKAPTLGFEKEPPMISRLNASPMIVAPTARKTPRISETEKGLFFTKGEFEKREFPWERVNASLGEMAINMDKGTAGTILIADSVENNGFRFPETAQQQELNLRIALHTVKTSKVTIIAETSADSYAQLSYAYYPWMEIRIDGQKAQHYKSAFNLLVLELPKGTHTIEITPTLTQLRKATLALSLAALILTAALLAGQIIFKRNHRTGNA